jgi:hypothetical protein
MGLWKDNGMQRAATPAAMDFQSDIDRVTRMAAVPTIL